jgi:TM2 domain-containing membrane protein YozV
MNTYDKIRSFCRKFRIAIGVVALALGFVFAGEGEFYNLWFALGIIPLIAGLVDFCPICIISKKCTIK